MNKLNCGRPLANLKVDKLKLLVPICFILVIVGCAIVGGLLWYRHDQTEAQSYERLWPSFTMVYTQRRIETLDGKLFEDQTWRLVVTDDFNWRQDLIRDGINPKEVGSFISQTNERILEHSAWHNRTRETIIPKSSTFSITRELTPGFLGRIVSSQAEGKAAWSDVRSVVPGQVVKVQTSSVPCPSPVATPASIPNEQRIMPSSPAGSCANGGTTIVEEYRVAFDARTVRSDGYAGVPVSAEERFNGSITRTFMADSLEIQSPVR